MQSITRSIFSMVVVSAITISSGLLADAAKCSPCQLKKSIKDALEQSIKDAQMAALTAGGAFVRDADLDEVPDEEEMKMSLVESAAVAIAVAENLLAQAAQLDAIPSDAARAPREELVDPCNNCGSTIITGGSCNISEQLCALRCCCASVAHRLERQGKDARKCCKKLRHKIDDVEDLVETLIDQSAECCSVTEAVLGDPATASFIDLPLCQSLSVADAFINAADADVITWLKTLCELLYRVHLCVCCDVVLS